eukprot:gnl/MRDRNA2_/MRDRNA2_166920_c0_seq1.p1 gnl/MRDRNA2_/MRDRNA2_166920_c0~~gnl/MRDRNA2_/MRDRNA2_166920_c0_seq1.p1  ORF type:complete len:352 (+),score=51.85 gnl/MRDRNA2_/MRDRNA2_166920_c0_seq1:79-1056(+)
MGAASPSPCRNLKSADDVRGQSSNDERAPFGGDRDPPPFSDAKNSPRYNGDLPYEKSDSKIPHRSRDTCTPCEGPDFYSICEEPRPGRSTSPRRQSHSPRAKEVVVESNAGSRRPSAKHHHHELSHGHSYVPHPAIQHHQDLKQYHQTKRHSTPSSRDHADLAGYFTEPTREAPRFPTPDVRSASSSQSSMTPAKVDPVPRPERSRYLQQSKPQYTPKKPFAEQKWDMSADEAWECLTGGEFPAHKSPYWPPKVDDVPANDETSSSMAPMSQVENLMMRYPEKSRSQIETALKNCGGHAGRASMSLEGRRGIKGSPVYKKQLVQL